MPKVILIPSSKSRYIPKLCAQFRRIVQAIFAAATGVVRIRQQDGGVAMSGPFNIERGVLQGDIFSPVCFIAGLDRIFRLCDHVNPGMTVGTGAHTVRMAKFEYADDAAFIDEDAGQATARVTSPAAGSIAVPSLLISAKKSKVMHIHKMTRTSATTDADVAKLNLGQYTSVNRAPVSSPNYAA